MGPAAPQREIRIDHDLSELTRVHCWLEESQRHHQLSDQTTFALRLCAEEAITNIMAHGGACRHIDVRLRVDSQQVFLEIGDDGAAFDPRDVPDPSFTSNLEDAAVGGLGIHLIREFTDTLRYARVDGRNLLTMRILRRQATETSLE